MIRNRTAIVGIGHTEYVRTIGRTEDQTAYEVSRAALADAGIVVDMIIQNMGSDAATDMTFTVPRGDYSQALEIARSACEGVGAEGVEGDDQVAKVSIVGLGMKDHAGVASRMFSVLATEGINIQMISTSEIKVSVVIDEKYGELAVRALHAEFVEETEEARPSA